MVRGEAGVRPGWNASGSESPGAECVLTRRSPEDLSRFIVELQQRELALKDRNGSIASR